MERTKLEKNREYFGMFLNLRKKFQDRHSEQTKVFYGHVNAVITALGVIGGFGFTAVSNVKNIYLFTLGELFVVGSILYLLWFFTSDYLRGIKSTEELLGIFEKNSLAVKKALVENNEAEQQRIAEDFDKQIENTEHTPSPEPATKYYKIRLYGVFVLTVLGVVFLLVSFLPFHTKPQHFSHSYYFYSSH